MVKKANARLLIHFYPMTCTTKSIPVISPSFPHSFSRVFFAFLFFLNNEFALHLSYCTVHQQRDIVPLDLNDDAGDSDSDEEIPVFDLKVFFCFIS